MKSQIKTIMPWAAIVIFFLFKIASYFLGDLSYSLRSQKSSPDGSYTIFEFHAGSDGAGHAPYGTSLSLSTKKNIKNPDDGYVFFAGYCNNPFSYSWQSSNMITVYCQAVNENSIPTQAVHIYGIKVEVKEK